MMKPRTIWKRYRITICCAIGFGIGLPVAVWAWWKILT